MESGVNPEKIFFFFKDGSAVYEAKRNFDKNHDKPSVRTSARVGYF